MKQVETSQLKSVENGFEQKVNDQDPASSFANDYNVGVSRMRVHSSDWGHFDWHVFAELEDNFLSFKRIRDDISISPVVIILINKLHETSNKMSVSAVEENEITTKRAFLPSVKQFWDLNILENGGHFLIFILPQQTVPFFSSGNKVLIVLMPLQFPNLVAVVS